MSDTVRMEVRIAVEFDVPKTWAGGLLAYVRGGGETEPPVDVSDIRLTGLDGRTIDSVSLPIILSSRPAPSR